MFLSSLSLVSLNPIASEIADQEARGVEGLDQIAGEGKGVVGYLAGQQLSR